MTPTVKAPASPIEWTVLKAVRHGRAVKGVAIGIVEAPSYPEANLIAMARWPELMAADGRAGFAIRRVKPFEVLDWNAAKQGKRAHD